MKTGYSSKNAARQAVWDKLKDEKLTAFPFPPHGRIPNFKGAKEAALQLFKEPELANAKAIKVNPDSPQKYVRAEALRRGITVYVPTPRLKAGFLKLDPAEIPFEAITEASLMSKVGKWAKPVALLDLPQLDAIVTGCVAVTLRGQRAGKGAGYSDIEFAILRDLGHNAVPVATTVNNVQVVDSFPTESIDLPLTIIATPRETFRIETPPQPPRGIEWDRLTDHDLNEMPILKELRSLKKL